MSAAPEAGYNGRELKILFDGEVIAAVQSREIAGAREPVDVSNDDDNGHRRLLPDPGMRSLDLTIEGVITINNYNLWLQKWEGNTFENVTLQHPNGAITSAEFGFFLSELSMSGAHNEHIAFSAKLASSGVVTNDLTGAGST